ncbi:MAG: serine/threonine-protein phosphatase [Blastocatellia bacterium]|nr:serine/threonine-protein phosphatase [Blastocatellia bacterium]
MLELTIENRDRIYLIGFLLGAGLLLFAGRNLLQQSVLVTWGLTFGGTTAAAVLLVALYRVRLELQASRHQLAIREAELNFAREVQRSLFPRQLPQGGGLEFAGVCIPARGISGDYYDVLQLPDGRLIFAIADISGKGISAAILMANLQAVLRTLVETSRSPGEVCSRLNHHLHQVTDESKFATFFFAQWDPARRLLCYINAGHHAPILMGSHRGRRLDQGGVPLGMFPDSEFHMGELALEPRDLLVLYSDGVTEAASVGGEEFGEGRLTSIVEAHSDRPLVEIKGHILDAVRNWSGKELEDDVTLLIARATE